MNIELPTGMQFAVRDHPCDIYPANVKSFGDKVDDAIYGQLGGIK
jgi:hypothetical protein